MSAHFWGQVRTKPCIASFACDQAAGERAAAELKAEGWEAFYVVNDPAGPVHAVQTNAPELIARAAVHGMDNAVKRILASYEWAHIAALQDDAARARGLRFCPRCGSGLISGAAFCCDLLTRDEYDARIHAGDVDLADAYDGYTHYLAVQERLLQHQQGVR